MGKIIAGDSDSYQYLIESIEKFPSQPDFARLWVSVPFSFSILPMMPITSRLGMKLMNRVQEAGFKTGQMREGKGGAWTNYTGGIATAWTGVKVWASMKYLGMGYVRLPYALASSRRPSTIRILHAEPFLPPLHYHWEWGGVVLFSWSISLSSQSPCRRNLLVVLVSLPERPSRNLQYKYSEIHFRNSHTAGVHGALFCVYWRFFQNHLSKHTSEQSNTMWASPRPDWS